MQTQRGYIQRVHLAIIDAVLSSMLQMTTDIKRSLQTKHWDHFSIIQQRSNQHMPYCEMEANTHFLVASLNDLHRIWHVHSVEILQEVIVGGGGGGENILLAAAIRAGTRIQDSCLAVGKLAISGITRIIFSDVQQLLVTFDDRWPTDSNNALIRTICGVLSRHFPSLRAGLNTRDYMEVLSSCARVTAMRLLILLRDRGAACGAAIGAKLPAVLQMKESDINRLRKGLSLLQQLFKDHTVGVLFEEEDKADTSMEDLISRKGVDSGDHRVLQKQDSSASSLPPPISPDHYFSYVK